MRRRVGVVGANAVSLDLRGHDLGMLAALAHLSVSDRPEAPRKLRGVDTNDVECPSALSVQAHVLAERLRDLGCENRNQMDALQSDAIS